MQIDFRLQLRRFPLPMSMAMTDEGLAQLSHDHLLESLYFFKPKITDARMTHLASRKPFVRPLANRQVQ
jgi:hypothetical protein